MKKYLYLTLVLCCATVVSCKQNEAKTSQIQLISVEEMSNLSDMDNVQLIDVRTPQEYQSGHIKGAKNIVYMSDNWSDEVAKLDKDNPVYVYCAKGGRSARCAALLAEAGFKKIYDLKGGITQWKHQGKAVE
ncbi:MAG: rhodanese-like domain-containing protein [Dokdonia sp.]|jgi:rhodanese-related sulfurtransferase